MTQTSLGAIFEGEEHIAASFSDKPFKLTWIFGHDNKIPAHNISDDFNKCALFIGGTAAVLFNWIRNTQTILEGHINDITCSTVSLSSNLLTTFDHGDDNSLIIWNLQTRVLLKILKNFFSDGLECMRFSNDETTLLMLTSLRPMKSQKLYSWNWKPNSKPTLVYVFPSELLEQLHLAIHPKSRNDFLTSSHKKVIFFQVKNYEVSTNAPQFFEEDIGKPLGAFTQSVFLPQLPLVFSATSFGFFVEWGTKESRDEDSACIHPKDRILLRFIQPFQEKTRILCLYIHDDFLVTGDALGHINFYDLNLNIVKCYRNFHYGPVNHVSFTKKNAEEKKVKEEEEEDIHQNMCESSVIDTDFDEPNESSNELQSWDFLISTDDGCALYYDTKSSTLTNVLSASKSYIKAFAIHHSSSIIAMGDYDGLIQIWDYEKKEFKNSEIIPSDCKWIECLEFNTDGNYLACGLYNGHIFIFDIPTLTKAFNFNLCNFPFTMCKFSPDDQFLIFVDTSKAITVFRLYLIISTKSIVSQAVKNMGKPNWELLSREKRHYLPIKDILFTHSPEDESLLMYTLGGDRELVIYAIEYSLYNSLSIIGSFTVEQIATPLCMSYYPCFNMPHLLAIVNNEHKLKIHDMKNKKCLKVNLLPIYDSPIKKIITVEECGTEDKFFIFNTDFSIGLIALPVDGNPHKARAIRTHPHGIRNVIKDPYNRFIFSSSERNKWLYMWTINYKIMHDIAEEETDLRSYLTAKDDPFWIKNEIMNISLALQIQRLECTFPSHLQLTSEILISDVINIIVGLGYYPSKYEIELFQNDLNFSLAQSKGVVGKTIDMEDIIKLYINHRPVRGAKAEDLKDAFKILLDLKKYDDDYALPLSHFSKALAETGEPMSSNEFYELIMVLANQGPPDENINSPFVCSNQDDISYYKGSGENFITQRWDFTKEPADIDWGVLDTKIEEPDDSYEMFTPDSSKFSQATIPSLIKDDDEEKVAKIFKPEAMSAKAIVELMGFTEHSPKKIL